MGVAAALCALWLAAPSAGLAGLDDAAALLKAGQHEQALVQVDQLLAANPKDPQARFLKGVILAEQGDAKAAGDVFERLTQDYPALPEPYNNLAVIYAAQGRYDQARVALEKSIRTHPSYATAYSNLGDVYSKLAGDAYDRALRLDASDAGGRKKLALVHELATPATPLRVASRASAPPPAVIAKAAPPATAIAAPAKSALPEAGKAQAAKPAAPALTPAKDAAEPPPTLAAAAQAAKPAIPAPAPKDAAAKALPATPSPASKPTAVVASTPSQPAKSTAPNPETDALRMVKAWAQAWSAKNVDAYLSFYAADFRTPDGEPRAKWEDTRRARVSAPRSINVSVRNAKVVRHDDRRVAVTFEQKYRSDRFQGQTRKTLELVRVGDDWRILEEVVKK